MRISFADARPGRGGHSATCLTSPTLASPICERRTKAPTTTKQCRHLPLHLTHLCSSPTSPFYQPHPGPMSRPSMPLRPTWSLKSADVYVGAMTKWVDEGDRGKSRGEGAPSPRAPTTRSGQTELVQASGTLGPLLPACQGGQAGVSS